MPQQHDDAALAQAIADTQRERFAQAWGEEVVHDETGDRSLEQQDDGLEGKVEGEGVEAEVAKPEGEEGEAEVDAKDDAKDDTPAAPKRDAEGKFAKAGTEAPKVDEPEPTGRVPAARLREEAEKRRAVETELAAERNARAEDKRERDAIRAQMDLLARQVAQRQQPEVKAAAPAVRPDKFADPDGYDLWVENQIAAARNGAHEDFTKRMVNMNLAATREAHGDKFDAAYQGILTAAQSEPEARIAIQKIWNSDNPGAELLRWHRNRETLNEVGPDPAAYRQKIIDQTRAALLADPEVHKTILAGLKTDAAGTARHVTRVPTKQIPSLNSASGSGQLADPDSDMSDTGRFRRAWGMTDDA